MIEYVEEMIKIILGDYFFQNYLWANALLNLLIFIFALLIIYLTYQLWKFILIGWWRK